MSTEARGRLNDAIENYYHYNPDTLMPLLMLALAAQDKLHITHKQKKSAYLACSLSLDEIKDYEWVILDENLSAKVRDWQSSGIQHVNVEMDLGRSLYPIYQIFLRNDTRDVVLEHHHRMGRLVQHSSNAASEKTHRQYATYILADALLSCPIEELKEDYLEFFNHILQKSQLQPERPRIQVAHTLSALINYDGKGLVYNPFAGCSLAGAMLRSAENYYGDGDTNDKLYAAGLLLNYGMGVSNEHFMQRDSTLWLEGKKIDYLLSTYTGFINGNTAFDFCLGKCLADEQFTGKYAGMVVPREIFDKTTDNFREAVNRDWIDTIVIMEFGEVAVLVDADKQENKGVIRLIDCNNPLARHTPIEEILEDSELYADFISLEDAKQAYFFKEFLSPYLPDREGYEKVRLGDIVERINRKVYDLSLFKEDEKVLAFINRQETWFGNRWDENIKRRRISNLYGPAYFLDENCLIVNSAGLAEPRLFNAEVGFAFFEDGYAFSLDNFEKPDWLAKELKKPYILRQLHPYGNNEMVPEPLSEEDYLNLTLYREVEIDLNLNDSDLELNETEDNNEQEEDKGCLDVGFELNDGKYRYTILDFIANGAFGYTYKAEMTNTQNGDKEIVAIKEFYPQGVMPVWRENNKVIYPECQKEDFARYREMFESEPNFILSMKDTPDNHVTEVKTMFYYEPTGTVYYVMKFYAGQSLKNMIFADQVPSSEKLLIEKIVIPMCKGLHAMHSHRILHLDIKPDNVVIDENGEAILIDFGVAQQYDENGLNSQERGDTHSYDRFSAPENSGGGMKHFCPQSDIYSTASTLYTMLTGLWPKPVNRETYDDAWENLHCSDQMKHAIMEGMKEFLNDRPATAQAFLNLFPGCEDIKL